MIYSYLIEGRKFVFSKRSDSRNKSANVFTLVVGKNGTGKSRLFRSIVFDLLSENANLKSFADVPVKLRDGPLGKLDSGFVPSKIVCVSTSPFDRFPLPRRDQDLQYYSYLGLRGLATANLGLAYLGRVIHALVESSLRSITQASSIATVLDYLGYERVMRVSFKFSSPILARRIMDAGDPRIVAERFPSGGAFRPEYVHNLKKLLQADERTIRHVMKSLSRLLERPARQPIDLWLGEFGVDMSEAGTVVPEDVILLSKFGVLQLGDVELKKKNLESPFMLSEMSSGEQAVIMSLLGIGSQIKDNSLICIDEPEICLHPEWQERYIQLLSSIFSHHNGCQFIIATHSPQIVAQLPEKHCFVMEMESGSAQRSTEFARKSIDFQLATLFKAPGFKNEYLSRVSINLFLKVGKAKSFDAEDDEQLDFLLAIGSNVAPDDPVREVIQSLDEMRQQWQTLKIQ